MNRRTWVEPALVGVGAGVVLVAQRLPPAFVMMAPHLIVGGSIIALVVTFFGWVGLIINGEMAGAFRILLMLGLAGWTALVMAGPG